MKLWFCPASLLEERSWIQLAHIPEYVSKLVKTLICSVTDETTCQECTNSQKRTKLTNRLQMFKSQSLPLFRHVGLVL